MRLATLLLLLVLRGAAAQTSPAARSAAALLEARDGAAAVVTGESRSGRSGFTYITLRPAVRGVEVADDPALVVLDAAGAVVYTRGEIAGGAVASDADVLGADAAIARAAAALGVASARGASGTAPAARRVFVRTDAGALRLAYEVALYPVDPRRWAVVRIDAATGAVLSERRLAVFETDAAAPRAAVPFEALPEALPSVLLPDGAAYRVVAPPARSPLDGGRALVQNPADALASPYGWHDTDARPGPEFTTTRGNNAHAFPDRDSNGQPDATGVPDGGASLAFDFPLDPAAGPEVSREAAVTNAFFWVNHAHDVFYRYGFDEAAGNFQASGYGRGGAPGADAVSVRVQNGGGLDNAFMVVPSDGFPPVLTLFESTRTQPHRDYALDAEVLVHELAHGLTARLTGGPADTSCLGTGGEDMAEGWSDWLALMLTMRAGETRADARRYGVYTGGPDVRLAPYATDFAVNGLTYASTVGMTARHAVGTVWATVLWEIAWDLIDAHGFSLDLSDARGAAGNQIALSLVVEALRLQPCRPGFVDARNAVLLADRLLYGGANYALLQTAFARRGLGRGAAQGLVSTTADNVASFVVETEPADLTPPAAPTDLVATVERPGEARLRFTAPGDDGTAGQAARYEVRFSRQPITTPTDFDAAPDGVATLPPSAAGQTDAVALYRLFGYTRHYVAIRAVDEVGNVSPVAYTSFVSGAFAPNPSPPSLVTVDRDTVVVRVAAGAVGTGPVAFRNADTIGRTVRAQVAGVGTFPHLTARVSTNAAATPYPTLGAAGTPVTGWLPTSPGLDPLDAGYADVALPFPFPFDTYTFRAVRVYTDGFLSFDLESSALPPAPTISDSRRPNAVVAPYWADLTAEGGGVFVGTLPDGRFAVEYRDVRLAGDPAGASVSFVVTLAPSGEIAMAYGRTAAGVAAVRGVEGVLGAGYGWLGLGAPAQDRTMDLLVPSRGLLSVVESFVIVPALGEASLTVRVDASRLRGARYTGIVYPSRQPDQYEYPAPVPLVIDVASVPIASEPDAPAVSAVTLGAVRPNPARGRVAVAFALPEARPVRLAVYDARGREVAVLADGVFEAGLHDAVWAPGAAAPGLYALRLVAGRETRTATVVVVR